MLPAFCTSLTQIIAGRLWFHFLRAIHEMAILLRKISLDYSPLGEQFTVIYSSSDSPPKAYDVLSVTMNSGSSRT